MPWASSKMNNNCPFSSQKDNTIRPHCRLRMSRSPNVLDLALPSASLHRFRRTRLRKVAPSASRKSTLVLVFARQRDSGYYLALHSSSSTGLAGRRSDWHRLSKSIGTALGRARPWENSRQARICPASYLESHYRDVLPRTRSSSSTRSAKLYRRGCCAALFGAIEQKAN